MATLRLNSTAATLNITIELTGEGALNVPQPRCGVRRQMARRVFTPAAIKIVRNLASEGKSAAEIAHAIGSTAGSVRVKCSQLKIRLSRGGPSLVPSFAGRRLVVHVRPDDYAALEHQAARLQKTVGEFTGMLLEAIVTADLYEAVLDERD